MYQITRITDKDGQPKTGEESRRHLGCLGEARMDEGCVLIHCCRDRAGEAIDRYIRTSPVQTWNKDKETGRVVIETMNTVYYLDPVK